MKKRLISLALTLAICLGLTVPAFAEQTAVVGRPMPVSSARAEAYIDINHDLWTWGWNKDGVLGNGTQAPLTGMVLTETPSKVLDNVQSVSAGAFSTCAVKTDGSLWVWGANETNDLGFQGGNDSDATYVYNVPIQTIPYKLMDNVAAVCNGQSSTAAIKKDGSLWIWGSSLLGYDEYKPKKLADNVIAVSLCISRLAYVTADHTLWTKEFTDAPQKVMSDVIDVAVGYDYMMVIKSDNSLWSWGQNGQGQLGIDSVEPSDVPIKIMDGVKQISVDDRRVAAVKLDNSLWVWGDNSDYQLGTTKVSARKTGFNPYQILWTPEKIMDDVAYADMGDSFLVVKTDGSFYTREQGEMAQVPGVTIALDTAATTTPVTPVTPPSSGFSDVPDNAYYAAPVKWAVSHNITNGTTDTTFSPDQTCTTAQILTFLWRACGEPAAVGRDPFTNVSTSDYYYTAAMWASQKGMVTGPTFPADTPCTRANAVKFIWQAMGSPAPTTTARFADVAGNASYAQAVSWAVGAGVTNGTSSTTFSPNNTCTRGQIVTFLYRAASAS